MMADENNVAPNKLEIKKLIKRGFIKPQKNRYFKDVSTTNYNTNKHRMMRILFIAEQLARDAGVELLIMGYFPNVNVGSCGAWPFGEETEKMVKKSMAKNFLKHWENVFSIKEDARQNPQGHNHAVVDGIENEDLEVEVVTENKELEAGLDFSEENNVDEVNTEEIENLEAEDSSGDPEHDAERCTSNTATQLLVTITPHGDGTYTMPENLLGQLEEWELNASHSLNSVSSSSQAQASITESNSDPTGTSNVSEIETPLPSCPEAAISAVTSIEKPVLPSRGSGQPGTENREKRKKSVVESEIKKVAKKKKIATPVPAQRKSARNPPPPKKGHKR